MNYSIIRYITGWVILVISLFMLLPALVSVIYGEYTTVFVFLGCAVVFGATGFLLRFKKPSDKRFFSREGYIVATLSWIIISLIAAIPFTISGEIPFYIDAIFEVVSGFTTTGASILNNIEGLSRGMLFWRCFTNWLGGMGVLVFVLAIIPAASGQAVHFLRAESTGPTVGKLVPKLRHSTGILYKLYVVMTIIQIVLLIIAGVPVFDSFCVSFGTAGTGGFAVLNDSIASYSVLAKNIISVFMLLFGVNFNFYFLLLARKFKDAFSLEEVKWYFTTYFAATFIIGASIHMTSPGQFTFTDTLFQTSSIMTTTGFSTVDFNYWPALAQTILILLMFIGSCAGSTAGGIKISRFVIYLKTIKKQLSYLIHPRSVKTLKMDNKPITHETVRIVNVYFAIYIVFFVISFLLILLEGFDILTSFTSVAATLNNIGPGLGDVGPSCNFSQFSPIGKIILSINMLAGRLEIFPLVIFFMPSAWRRN